MEIPHKLGRPSANPEESYIPYLPAIESGLIELESVKVNKPQDAALSIINGKMPQKGGVVKLSDDSHGAFDLVALKHGSDKELVLFPTSKDAVCDDNDEIRNTGLVIFSTDEGLIKPFAFVDRASRAIWRPEEYRNFGSVSLRFLGLSSSYEAVEVESSGVIVARKPMRYF